MGWNFNLFSIRVILEHSTLLQLKKTYKKKKEESEAESSDDWDKSSDEEEESESDDDEKTELPPATETPKVTETKATPAQVAKQPIQVNGSIYFLVTLYRVC